MVDGVEEKFKQVGCHSISDTIVLQKGRSGAFPIGFLVVRKFWVSTPPRAKSKSEQAKGAKDSSWVNTVVLRQLHTQTYPNMSSPDQDSPADHSLLHGGSSADEPLVHDGPSRRLISPPSFTERSHLSVGSDIALDLALEERLADRFPVCRTSAAARAFAARRRERQSVNTSSTSSVIRRRRHTLTEVSHLHDTHCDINMFEENEDHDQDQSIGAATYRSVQSMPLPQTMPLLSASFHADALASDSQSDTDHIQDYQWHSDDDIVAAQQNHRRMSDLVGIGDDDDNDDSSLSSHHFVLVDDDADPPEQHLDIQRHLIQAQARESTAKLSLALTGLWSAINTSQQEACHHLQAARNRQRSLEKETWKANEKLRETERCMKEIAKKYKALEKQNKKLSIKMDRLQAENERLAMDKSNAEAEFREQMNNLVEMSLQTERDYKNMVTERDVRISQLEEEAIHLSEVLVEVEGRAEAEMRRRTWSEVSHGRDSVDLSSLTGDVNTSEREEALSYLEAPFANTTQREAATEVEESAASDTETSGEKIASPSTRTNEVKAGIFRGSLFNGANDLKKTKKDYGLESFADSMRYLASPSACSTRDEDRMTGEDEGLHYV